jgi:hypothetical protein
MGARASIALPCPLSDDRGSFGHTLGDLGELRVRSSSSVHSPRSREGLVVGDFAAFATLALNRFCERGLTPPPPPRERP